jgi:hypothetical protein
LIRNLTNQTQIFIEYLETMAQSSEEENQEKVGQLLSRKILNQLLVRGKAVF